MRSEYLSSTCDSTTGCSISKAKPTGRLLVSCHGLTAVSDRRLCRLIAHLLRVGVAVDEGTAVNTAARIVIRSSGSTRRLLDLIWSSNDASELRNRVSTWRFNAEPFIPADALHNTRWDTGELAELRVVLELPSWDVPLLQRLLAVAAERAPREARMRDSEGRRQDHVMHLLGLYSEHIQRVDERDTDSAAALANALLGDCTADHLAFVIENLLVDESRPIGDRPSVEDIVLVLSNDASAGILETIREGLQDRQRRLEPSGQAGGATRPRLRIISREWGSE